ncbi:unnamed protein product [Ixodes pacificus]
MLRRRMTDALNEVANRIRAVQRGGARTHLTSEYLAVLRDRHQHAVSFLRLTSRTVVEQRLQDRPVDDPEVLRCLRAVRTGGGGPPFIHNVQLADGSFSDGPHHIDTVFRYFFSQLFCSDHLPSENFAEKVRRFCGDVPTCPELLASSLLRPTDRDELFEILRAMKSWVCPRTGRLASRILRFFLGDIWGHSCAAGQRDSRNRRRSAIIQTWSRGARP